MSHKISTTGQNHNNNNSGFSNQQNTTTSGNSNLFKQLNFGLRRLFKLPLDFYSCMVSSGKLSLRRSSTLQISALVSSFALILTISATLAPLYNKTDITEAATGTAATSSLTMNVTNATALVDLSVLKDNGSFASSTNPIALNVTTNNYTGYTLSIKSSNNNQVLTNNIVNGDGSGYATLNSISSTVSTSTFSEDSASAANNYNGKWGILPSKYNSTDNTSYIPAPTTTATTLDKTAVANSSVNSYTIGLGARAGYTTPAGTYTGTYMLTAVGNPINYTINYNKNTTDTVTNLPAKDDSSTSETTIALNAQEPERSGYTFEGWCSTATSDDSCTGTTYEAGDDYGIDQTTENEATLYAMWKQGIPGLCTSKETCMQTYTLSMCQSGTSFNNTTLTDARDGKTYTVRYISGQCWMTQNLNITGIVDSTYSNFNGGSINITEGNLATCDSDTQACTITSNDVSYGTWYNYCAASAKTICSRSVSTEASYSICPANWKLPSNTVFSTLGSASGENKYVDAFRPVYGGYYEKGWNRYSGTQGFWWSSTTSGDAGRYAISYLNGRLYTGSNPSRTWGLYMRCVLAK